MERRFSVRQRDLLGECEMKPEVLEGMLLRLEEFLVPFAVQLRRSEQVSHAKRYLAGLLSDLERKNAEAIAYRHDQDRRGLQNFLGISAWDSRPLVGELVGQVAKEIGQADGVLVIDPSGFAKRGKESVGVARQWLGRLGKVDNGQVGIYLAYVSKKEHVLVDQRLYLPREWTKDPKRCRKCGVPKQVRYQTRHDLALSMLDEHRVRLPHCWVAGDDEMGRSSRFRGDLAERDEQYLLAVPSNLKVRDLEETPPASSGKGAKRKAPFRQARHWLSLQDEKAWTKVTRWEGHKGPQQVLVLVRRVVAKAEKGRVGPEETLVVLRSQTEEGKVKDDYYLSNAPAQTAPEEFVRVASFAHRIEQCFERGKGQAGLADYEVRTWMGWQHHQTLSLLASWFLVQESLRGKKIHAGSDRAAGSRSVSSLADRSDRLCLSSSHRHGCNQTHEANRPGPLLSLASSQPIGSVERQPL